MEYRNLGRTGVKVSALCLGGMNFGAKCLAEVAEQIIAEGIEAGINFIDTADVYSAGASEQIIGAAVEGLDCRDRIILATKVHGRTGSDLNDRGNHRRHIIQACEASLGRLRTDYIDLYQIHRPQSDIPIDETLRAADDLIRQGKVLYIGSSTFAAWQICESLWAARELGLNRFVCEQPPYNLLDRRIERELIPFCRTYGLAVVPWAPLAGGLLTGKYRRGQAPPPGSRLEHGEAAAGRFTPQVFSALDKFRDLAESLGCTVSQLAISWCMQQPGITSPIIGPRTPEQLEDNLKAAEIKLGSEDLQQIDQISPPGSMISEFYKADFGPHMYRW